MSEAQGSGAVRADVPSWAQPQVVFVLVAGYLLLHFTLRFALSPTLSLDDAEQALFSQELLLGYRFRQPPLYTWILYGVSELFGHTLLAHTLTRYLLQGLGYLFLYLAARRIIGDLRLAALALYSYTLIYVFAWYVHIDLTHTVAVGTMIAASLHALTLATDRGRAGDFLWLGVTIGLGFLAKYNYALLPLAALIGVAATPKLRHRLARPAALLTLLAAAAVVAPYLVWVAEQHYSFTTLSYRVVEGHPEGAGLVDRLLSFGNLLVKAVEFTLPFAILAPLLLPALLKARPKSDDDPMGYRRFLGMTMASAVLILAVGVAFSGAEHLKSRWLHPALMPLPIWAFARLRSLSLDRRAVRRYLAAVLGLCALVLVARIAVDRFHPLSCGSCRAFLPIGALAEQLRQAGFRRGTIVTHRHDVAGNLRLHLPGSRLIDVSYPPVAFPDQPVATQCLLLWSDDQELVPKAIRTYLREAFEVEDLPERRDGTVSAPLIGNDERPFALSYVLIEGGAGRCR